MESEKTVEQLAKEAYELGQKMGLIEGMSFDEVFSKDFLKKMEEWLGARKKPMPKFFKTENQKGWYRNIAEREMGRRITELALERGLVLQPGLARGDRKKAFSKSEEITLKENLEYMLPEVNVEKIYKEAMAGRKEHVGASSGAPLKEVKENERLIMEKVNQNLTGKFEGKAFVGYTREEPTVWLERDDARSFDLMQIIEFLLIQKTTLPLAENPFIPFKVIK